MPNRIVRDGILRSKAVGRLDPLAQLFYRCLHSVADDFGRYYADTELLLSDCFPLRPKWATEALLAEWLIACERENLLRTYGIDGTNYLEILKFGQRIRPGSKSKFPGPADCSGIQPISAADFGHKPECAAEGGSRAASSPPTTASHTAPAAAEIVSYQSPEPSPYLAEFTAAICALGYNNPDNDPATAYTTAMIAETCEAAGAAPKLGAYVASDLLKAQRVRGKPLEYLLGALRSQLARDGPARKALRRAASA